MRKIVFSFLVVICLTSTFSWAEVYISSEEAIKQIFPAYQEYKKESHILDNQEFGVYTVSKNGDVLGWAIVLDEKGKIQPITFLIGIDTQGKVLGAYVLEFRDIFGSEIKRRSFLRQFRGKSLKDDVAVGRDIDAVTSATISSQAAASAVRKALEITEELRKGF
ncbi:MAG: hypothetical protein A3G37_01220 [Omnitrophica WOR_2 bacterium RIFCSPLOWO2_12_FULL_46_30]|nr:MAG: hypothetical protein A3D27_02810 [Omnitrophica WOR_2 bacterium RIFCSPHIGHO2_02_FULL_46_37]OGX42151.1 MAG: hypothetical protein A3H41_01790 [Omnitrophica WOR_2 bacterium RIFCSPLOWO2_02_FULL_45_28]OGX50032.1 MAG: hypothetical protein A3G37_01220 [Omnitrophica WOR_2 bacterium RIFCSPLOWO2_12_FULL_46_30]